MPRNVYRQVALVTGEPMVLARVGGQDRLRDGVVTHELSLGSHHMPVVMSWMHRSTLPTDACRSPYR